VVKGLDQEAMIASLVNVIKPLENQNLEDYDEDPESRIFYLVDDYDPITGDGEAVGALRVDWEMIIKDYKNKSKDDLQYNTDIKVTARAVTYSDCYMLCADYDSVVQHFCIDNNLDCPPPGAKC